MKTILELNNTEANNFFLKKESYSNIELPTYFNFQKLLNKIQKKLNGKDLKDFRSSSPRNFEDVNYKLVTNKDGKFSWRPFQLIHPALYVNLVNKITNEENWLLIKNRFCYFQSNEKIECHSLPVISQKENEKDKTAQILSWWQLVEQKSLHLALEYEFVIHTDITDCYSSIYTHSIPWALHTKQEAKKRDIRKKEIIGNIIDNHLQDMSYGQTNGIPQGSVLMDFISEIVLGYVDSLLTEELEKLNIIEYKILRYRDDYRIFTNNSLLAEQITKILSEILSDLGLKLNADKTKASNDLIKSSIKSDKRYWIANKRIAGNKQKWLIQIYLLSEIYPNSGTVDTEIRKFLKVIENSKKTDWDVVTLISLIVEIALRNPRVIPTSIAILSIFLSKIDDEILKLKLIDKVKNKFMNVPNSSLIMIWFQRLYLSINKEYEFEEKLCKKVINKGEVIWNSDWLDSRTKDIIENTKFIEYVKVKKAPLLLSKLEFKMISPKNNYYS
ncbi:RNA-directed DNA polymerase [Epilithonimonas hominis]|uniref:RNA-directed DNA polymerase n=1 Tax=Epilithonimonas hominis TaxID=420404 RepID=UPI000ECB8808|nr:RNA-directed DNA polymerase [Epilithonimonas hominis]HAP95727.1 reverse transcriptase [Chryseobacterium sp.]